MLRNLALFLCLVSAVLAAAQAKPDENKIGYHDVRSDGTAIVPWYHPDPSVAYDHAIRLVWNFWAGVRKCPNGVPYYLQHQVWTPDKDDSRGIGGDQIPMALSSWDLLYSYLGDPKVKANMIEMADYWLDHGVSKSGLLWGDLPYPYNTDLHSGVYDGDMRAGKGSLQPDKAGSFGAEVVVLFKMTGNRRYLDAATRIADTLARNVRQGDSEHSPWPYRVNATTGEVHVDVRGDKKFTADYTSNWTPTLRLFSSLCSLGAKNCDSYQNASRIVSAWLKEHPVKNNAWGPFFEDIPTADYSDTEINADTFAAYVLEMGSAWDADWKHQARSALDWSYRTLQNHEYDKWGVAVLNEQTRYMVPGNSHTSRHASVELMYCEKTGDCESKPAAIRRLNWATYTVDDDGKNRYIRDDIWLTDGYGDYVRHYLRAMAAAPELAPNDQDHLLRTSSVIQSINYGADRIVYTKFDQSSTEVFKIGTIAQPKSVQGGTMHWDAATKLLTISARRNKVTVNLR